MLTFVLAFTLLASIIAAMSIGVIFQNKPIKGSCGGMAALGMNTDCDICGGDRSKCDEVSENTLPSQENSNQAQFYDASKKQ